MSPALAAPGPSRPGGSQHPGSGALSAALRLAGIGRGRCDSRLRLRGQPGTFRKEPADPYHPSGKHLVPQISASNHLDTKVTPLLFVREHEVIDGLRAYLSGPIVSEAPGGVLRAPVLSQPFLDSLPDAG